MLPGVGVFGTGQTVRALVPLLQKEGFPVQAVWGRTQEEAESLASELDIPFSTSQTDDVLLHPEVHLVCILTPPPHTRQIAVKALGEIHFLSLVILIVHVVSQGIGLGSFLDSTGVFTVLMFTLQLGASHSRPIKCYILRSQGTL